MCAIPRPQGPTDTGRRITGASPSYGSTTEELAYRAPMQWDALLDFFRMRALQDVERVQDGIYERTASIVDADGARHDGRISVTADPERDRLICTISDGLLPVMDQVTARVRHQFDLDCDPAVVHEGISTLDDAVPGANVPGTRMPGTFEPFETACRAVLGQQVSVVAANKLAARIVERYGRRMEGAPDGLCRTWPTPEEILAIGNMEDAFGELGVIRTRSATIALMAQMVADGLLDLSPSADPQDQMDILLGIKGIGPWTANYIAMRTMGYADAFLETDVGVKHALPGMDPKQRLQAAEAWRPWRGYANICLWNSLASDQ